MIEIYRHIVIHQAVILYQYTFKLYQYIEYRDISNIVIYRRIAVYRHTDCILIPRVHNIREIMNSCLYIQY